MASNDAKLASPALDVPISKLSVDHFSIIVKYLEVQDIQSARLAGRGLHFFLSPYLFKSIRFAPQAERLIVLEHISQNGVSRRSVRTLRYDLRLFELPLSRWAELDASGFRPNAICTRGQVYGQTSHQSHHNPPGRKIPFEALEECATFEAEQTLISKHLEPHLRHVLDSFPAISNVVFISTSEKYPTRFTPRNHRNCNFRKAILAYQFFALINAAGRSRCRITKIDVEGHWGWAYYPNNGYWGNDSRIPGSIKHAFPDFHKDARYWKERKPLILSSVFNFSPAKRSPLKFVFNNLTHLSLVIASDVFRLANPHQTSSDLWPSSYWYHLPEVLQSLENITHLSLDLRVLRTVDTHLQSFHYHDDIVELFQNPPVTFRRLTSLSLTYFQSCGLSLLSLLQRHPTIGALTLRNVIEIMDLSALNTWRGNRFLGDGPAAAGWIEAVETMRALRLQRLDLCGLEGIRTNYLLAGSENMNLRLARLKDYILHGYEPNPLGLDQRDVEKWDAELW